MIIFIWDFVAENILGQIMDWMYARLVETFGEFFGMLNEMGAQLFDYPWTQAVVTLFSRFGWALYLVGLVPRDGVYMLCAKVMESVLKVKNQGFLAVENLDISMDKVYFDPKTYEAYLVYLPLSAGEGENGPLFEAELRHLLLQFVKQSCKK